LPTLPLKLLRVRSSLVEAIKHCCKEAFTPLPLQLSSPAIRPAGKREALLVQLVLGALMHRSFRGHNINIDRSVIFFNKETDCKNPEWVSRQMHAFGEFWDGVRRRRRIRCAELCD
jgi:hypothetical protein